MEATDNPYLLLTPGPLSTSTGVRGAMLQDWCTWDDEYNELVQKIRKSIVALATKAGGYSSVLMQGSGTFSIESVVGSAIPGDGCLLVLINGAYGQRILDIAQRLKIHSYFIDFGETQVPDASSVAAFLEVHREVTHIAMVHCETTTGILNEVKPISEVARFYKKTFILDAMSSFGGIPFDMEELGVDFLISSANKCIQGVPGFGFIIARARNFELCNGLSRSLSLDLYEQWSVMEINRGKWRYTSPTHVVKAFYQALLEMGEEGGPEQRNRRYCENQKLLVKGMRESGFQCLLPDEVHSPVITSFLYPETTEFDFIRFYQALKQKGFVIYPGKITSAETFRIGTIGQVFEADIHRLLAAIKSIKFW